MRLRYFRTDGRPSELSMMIVERAKPEDIERLSAGAFEELVPVGQLRALVQRLKAEPPEDEGFSSATELELLLDRLTTEGTESRPSKENES